MKDAEDALLEAFQIGFESVNDGLKNELFRFFGKCGNQRGARESTGRHT